MADAMTGQVDETIKNQRSEKLIGIEKELEKEYQKYFIGKKKQPFLYFISVSQVFPAVLLIHAKQDFICQMPLNLHGCDRVAAFLCIRHFCAADSNTHIAFIITDHIFPALDQLYFF